MGVSPAHAGIDPPGAWCALRGWSFPAHAGIDLLNHLYRLKEALNGRASAGWATDWAKNYLAAHPYPHNRLNLPDAPRPTRKNQNQKEPAMTAAPTPKTTTKPELRTAGTLLRAFRVFSRIPAYQFLVAVKTPLRLDDGAMPAPDIMLLQPRADGYETAHPTAGNALLIAEVSETGLDPEQSEKARRYGQAGIAQFLVLNLAEDCIESFTGLTPLAYGRYIACWRGERIKLEARPELDLAVVELLPPLPPAPAPGNQV